MDNKIEVFKNEQFGEIRTALIENEPWFVAVDVCRALEIGNSSQAISRLDADEKMITLTLLWKVQSLVRHKRSNGLWLHGNGIIISRQSVTRRPCCNGSTRRTAWTREIGTWSITPIIFSQYGMDAPAVPGTP